MRRTGPPSHHRHDNRDEEDAMRYQMLGPSGVRVSELCLGTMSFGDVWGFGAPEKECFRIMDAYAEAGGNFLDTANKYHEGQSEEIVGAYLGADRDRWVVATKYTLSMRADDPNAAGNSRKNLRQSLDASLRRLRTDHIDLFWVHAWDYCTPVEEIMRALDDAVTAGKVLYVGLSDSPAWVATEANTLAALRGWSPFVAVQVEYSLLARTAERELLPMARVHGLGVTAWAPMGAGILTGKYTRPGRPDSLRADANAGRLTERTVAIAHEVDRVAAEVGATPAQVATAWVRQRGPGIIPVTGVRTTGQMGDVLGGVGLTLGDQHVAALSEVSGIDYGFPYDLLGSAQGQLVYGDREPQIDLPAVAPLRWAG
jgi:aryl-alcohol dehydrogenase-like predicted oxidoreductase